MKRDQNYINRLEVGDKFQNTRGETCKATCDRCAALAEIEDKL